MKTNNSEYMNIALQEAQKVNKKSVPIGAVLVNSKTGQVFKKNNNDSDTKNDPFSHAEIKILKEASEQLGNNYLNDYEIYITIEPCLTCFSLIKSYGIKKIVFGAENSKYGFSNFIESKKLFPKIEIVKDIKKDESVVILQDFFKRIRREKE